MSLDLEAFEYWPQDELRLIVPKQGKAGLGNGPWVDRDSLKFRSRVEDINGVTVSQGFKKFFNLGTGPEWCQIGAEDVLKRIEWRDAIATLKLDGSLLIRSVYRGKVMLRTRGSFTFEHLDNAAEMVGFQKLYPGLFDPALYPGASLLLEWTSPANVIVLKYHSPGLTLVGAVDHKSLDYFEMNRLSAVSKRLDVPLVEWFKLDPSGWDALQTALATNNEVEGWVIRLNNEQDLVKVKCAPYLTKHGLKSTLSSEKLADMWLQQGRPDYETFKASFIQAFDEETFLWAHGAISSLFDGTRTLAAIEQHMQQKALERAHLSRKDAALAGLAEYGQTKRFAAYMNLWEGKPIEEKLLKSILLQSTKQVEIGMFKATSEVDE